MSVKPIPEGYHTVTPYLLVPSGAKLIEFLQAAFGATERHRMPGPNGRIMHAEVQIGDSRIMMGEPPETWKIMTGFIYLYVPDVDAVYHRALAAGAESASPLKDEFYGDRTGGIKDPSGNLWWIATHTKDVSAEEMAEHSARKKS